VSQLPVSSSIRTKRLQHLRYSTEYPLPELRLGDQSRRTVLPSLRSNIRQTKLSAVKLEAAAGAGMEYPATTIMGTSTTGLATTQTSSQPDDSPANFKEIAAAYSIAGTDYRHDLICCLPVHSQINKRIACNIRNINPIQGKNQCPNYLANRQTVQQPGGIWQDYSIRLFAAIVP
jgi:hypothetical protein